MSDVVPSHRRASPLTERDPRVRAVIQAAYILGVAGYIYTMREWTLPDGGSLFWPGPDDVAQG